MGNVLTEFIELLVNGITTLAQGIGSGANQFVEDLFLKVSDTGAIEGLSTFGGTVAIFGGVGLCVGFTTLVFLWIKSIGKR